MRSLHVPARDLTRELSNYYANIGGDAWEKFAARRKVSFENIHEIETYWKQPDDDGIAMPPAIEDILFCDDWSELDTSVRWVYERDGFVIKVALEGCGLKQNYMEALAYEHVVHKLHGRELKNGRKVRIPVLSEVHSKYYWIVQQRVRGRTVNAPKDLVRMCKRLQIFDMRMCNVKLFRDAYWPFDFGCFGFNIREGEMSLPKKLEKTLAG